MKPWSIHNELEARFNSRTGEKMPDLITTWITEGDDKDKPVCLIHRSSLVDSKIPDQRANLISAAPEMYEALVAAYDQLSMSEYKNDQRVAFDIISPILAKARGES